MKFNIFVFFRIAIGVIFLISSMEKLLSPLENFIYTLKGYDLIHQEDLQYAIALIIPWGEFFIGVFLLLGLWTSLALIGSGAMACGFVLFVGQAIARKLPLLDCGCFGDLIHVPLWMTFLLDWTILALSILLYIKAAKAKEWSLDRLLD